MLRSQEDQSHEQRLVTYKRCLMCCEAATNQCGRCKEVLYCCGKCKQKDFKQHKINCGAPKFSPQYSGLFDLVPHGNDPKMDDSLFDLGIEFPKKDQSQMSFFRSSDQPSCTKEEVTNYVREIVSPLLVQIAALERENKTYRQSKRKTAAQVKQLQAALAQLEGTKLSAAEKRIAKLESKLGVTLKNNRIVSESFEQLA